MFKQTIMLTSTVNAIALIIDFFTEEERRGLAINLNGHEVTFMDQLISRWHKSEPRYEGVVLRTKIAMLIAANKNLFHRLIEYSKPEFQEKLNRDLLDFDNLFKIKKIKQDGDVKVKQLKVGQDNTKNVNRNANKTRSGSADSGQEFVELDKVWDNEDVEFLNQGLQAKKITGNIDIGEGQDLLKGITVTLQKGGEEREKFSEALIPPSEAALVEDEPTLHTITTSQTRSKTIYESNKQKIDYSENNNNKDLTTTQKEYSLADAYNKLFSFKLRDLRELTFQKLDVLFFESCQ